MKFVYFSMIEIQGFQINMIIKRHIEKRLRFPKAEKLKRTLMFQTTNDGRSKVKVYNIKVAKLLRQRDYQITSEFEASDK